MTISGLHGTWRTESDLSLLPWYYPPVGAVLSAFQATTFRLPKVKMILTKKQKWASLLIFVVVTGVIGSRYFWWGFRSATTNDGKPLPVSRRYYPLRHWSLAGLPGDSSTLFISDPHFLSSDAMPFSEPVLKMLASRDGTFRMIDINPGFNDLTSEILLLITIGDSTFQYSLEFPKGRNVQAVIVYPDLPQGRIFPYRNQLALLVDFLGRAKGVYLIQMPLKSALTLSLIPTSDPQFYSIAKEFHAIGNDETTKSDFCDKKRKDFITFYEEYSGLLCKVRGGTYEEFWK